MTSKLHVASAYLGFFMIEVMLSGKASAAADVDVDATGADDEAPDDDDELADDVVDESDELELQAATNRPATVATM